MGLGFDRPLIDFADPKNRFAFVDLPQVEQQGQNYICSFPYKRAQGWVPEKLAISLRSPRVAMISDGITATFDRVPRRAFGRNRNDLLVLRWSVSRAVDKKNQFADLNYEFRLSKASGSARIYVYPQNYLNGFNGGGVCQLR